MSDPKRKPKPKMIQAWKRERLDTRIRSAIRVESCRADGRCPECKEPSWRNLASGVWVTTLACGCHPCSDWHCNAAHVGALLTEALRQRDRAVTFQTEDESRRYDMEAKVASMREERDAAIRRADYWQTSEAVQVEVRERDAAIRESDAARDSVAMLNACVTGLTERAEKAEALLRECERFIAEHSTTWRSGRRLRDAMLARIREALSK